jgi:hypothetical protein
MAGEERAAEEREAAREAPVRVARPEPAARQGGLLGLAASVGNSTFARLARHGAGLLPGGGVHPEVEQALAARRGGGRSLDPATRDRVAEHLGDSLADVRVHDDPDAAQLARSVDARAFTTGTDVYFGHGEYRPGTAEGDRLIAHELTHVVQQRGAPTSGPLTVSEPGDAMELEAEAVADDLGDS